jgi:hypothetical protein
MARKMAGWYSFRRKSFALEGSSLLGDGCACGAIKCFRPKVQTERCRPNIYSAYQLFYTKNVYAFSVVQNVAMLSRDSEHLYLTCRVGLQIQQRETSEDKL